MSKEEEEEKEWWDITPKERKKLDKESPFIKENRTKKKLVTLKGLALTENNKVTRSKYFDFLNLSVSDYSDVVLTIEQAKSLHNHLRNLSTGTAVTAPMMCAGASCPFQDRCPLVQMRTDPDPDKRGHPQHGKAPVGKPCILEVQLIKEWIMRYFEEYDVDPSNFTEVGYINELAELQIMDMRVNMNIAKVGNSTFIIDQVVGTDREGDPIIQKQLSPFVEMKEKIANRRSKIIKLMVGDRQEKYKKEAALKVKIDSDPSSQQANMRARLESLKRDLDSVSSRLEDPSQPTKSLPGRLSPEELMFSSDLDDESSED